MKAEDLIDLIGEATDQYIADAKKAATHRRIKWFSTIAACLIIVLGCTVLLPHWITPENPKEEAPQESGAGHGEGSVFMSYAGPVFPMTLTEEHAALTAVRNVGYDFANYGTGGTEEEVWGENSSSAKIEDTYHLVNASQNEVTATAVYPIAGDFQIRNWPVVTVDGEEIQWELYAGGYAGFFRGAGDTHSTSLNLDNPTSWTVYQKLLVDGSYFAEAFTVPDSLNEPVIVYKLSNLHAGTDEYDAATLCMSFSYNMADTQIMTWGFNGGGVREDTGEEYRDFFIRDGLRKADEEVKYLIVVGDDLDHYTLQGYQDGGCEPGEELPDASAVVIREEMTMESLLREIAQIRYDALHGNAFDGDHNRYIDDQVSFELFYQAVVRHFAAYGPMGTDPKERYAFGMLDDIINESAYQERILYITFPVSIPAGGNIDVGVQQFKNASFDFACTGSENVGIDGYDMVTTLGSNLSFTKQTATIENFDGLEIVRQNFGFDLKNGITEVELDQREPHYYLEVRKIKE